MSTLITPTWALGKSMFLVSGLFLQREREELGTRCTWEGTASLSCVLQGGMAGVLSWRLQGGMQFVTKARCQVERGSHNPLRAFHLAITYCQKVLNATTKFHTILLLWKKNCLFWLFTMHFTQNQHPKCAATPTHLNPLSPPP